MTAHLAQFAMRTVADDDLNLVHASKNGDVAAFEQLVKRYDRKLLRIAHNVTHNTEDAQDAVQETFLKAFQHLNQFREDSKFSTWLIRITVNQSLMKMRKRATRDVSLDADFQAEGDVLPMEAADWAPNPEQLYWASELRDILVNALSELRPALRTVFVLRDIEGLSTDQTAEVLNLSHTAVKARLWRARLQLRERLNKYFGKHTTSGCPKSVPLDRRTDRISGPPIESLFSSISNASSVSHASSTSCATLQHPSPTIAAMGHAQCILNILPSH